MDTFAIRNNDTGVTLALVVAENANEAWELLCADLGHGNPVVMAHGVSCDELWIDESGLLDSVSDPRHWATVLTEDGKTRFGLAPASEHDSPEYLSAEGYTLIDSEGCPIGRNCGCPDDLFEAMVRAAKAKAAS